MQILDNGIKFSEGKIQYLWFKISDDVGVQRCRAVALCELTGLALDKSEPEDWNMLGKQATALRGLYNSGVNFVYSAMGIFKPQRVGVIQYYGAAGDGGTVEEAGIQALSGLTAVLGSLANYQQSQTRAPQKQWIEWYLEFITQRAQKLSAVLGHPDPRDTRRLRELDGSLPFDDGDLAAEQTAMLFRGMAKVKQDFVFQITAQQIAQEWLTAKYTAISRLVSDAASRQRGSISIGASLSIPIMAALSNSLGQSEGSAQSEAQSVGEGDAHSWGRGESDGHAVTESESSSVGGSETHTVSSTRGQSHSVSNGQSHSVTDGQAHTVSSGQSQSQGVSAGASQSQGQSSGASQSQGSSQSQSQSQSTGGSDTVGGSVKASPFDVGVTGNYGHTWSASESAGQASSQAQGASQSQGASSGASQSQGASAGASQSQGQSVTTSHSETHGTSRTETHGTSKSQGESHSYSSSWSRSRGHAETDSHQESLQEGWGESRTEGLAHGAATSQGGMQALTRGLSTGMIPGISVGRSWQTEDAVAQNLTEALNQLRSHFSILSRDGGFLSEVILFTENEAGAAAGDTLIPQAFHGPNSPTPVLTVRDDSLNQTLREHAATFLIHDEVDPNDPVLGVLGKLYSTYLTAEQLASYTAPAIFQEGTMRAIPAIPRDGMAFYPEMKGEVLLGHQFSPETADLTNTPIMLAKDRFVHIMFAGETGYGKTVAAERMVYEMVFKWGTRVIVLDFGAGWRKMLNAPGIEHMVDVRQFTPGGVRPLRWNPMQISRYISPEVQAASFVDIFGNLSQMGVKQQKHRFYDLLEELYLKHGVMINNPKVLNDAHWGTVVDATEATLSGGTIGQTLRKLHPRETQKIAVHRSKNVSLQMLYEAAKDKLESISARDQVGQNIYGGITSRLQALLRGSAIAQFAAGDGAIDVAELGSGEKRLLILEGGTKLDQFSKAWLLSWAGWIIYADMVERREQRIIKDSDLVMVFEEANILFTGMDAQDDNNPGAITAADQYNNMFRDSRKYGVRFAVITQAPSLIPAGVRASCGSMFIGKISDPKDKDIILSAMAKSEKGFRDEAWRRFLSDLGIGMILGRLPYSFDRQEIRPFLFQPLRMLVSEPTNDEIGERLGRIDLRNM